MATTRLSSKGQVIIPKPLREAHGWEAGIEFDVIDTEEGLLLKPAAPFAPTDLAMVYGMLRDRAETKSDAEIEAGLMRHIKREWRDRR